jgi:hypothetical protein
MPDSINHGIIGNVSAQNVAVGKKARIEVTAGDPRLAGQLEALLSAIAAFDGDPAARRQLEAAGGEIAQALEQPAPDPQRALSWLSTIASVAGSAGAVASAATALEGAVQAIF